MVEITQDDLEAEAETDIEFIAKVRAFQPTKSGGFHPIFPETLDRLCDLAESTATAEITRLRASRDDVIRECADELFELTTCCNVHGDNDCCEKTAKAAQAAILALLTKPPAP